MGVERSVTRWYIQRQMLLNELAQLEVQVAASQKTSETAVAPVETVQVSSKELLQKLALTQEKLKALGHCPKAMMG